MTPAYDLISIDRTGEAEMSATDAKNHIEEAYKLLTGEVWRGRDRHEMKPVEGVCVIVMELERVDCAIGPRGHSMFAGLAEKIQAAYVEITAARKALE